MNTAEGRVASALKGAVGSCLVTHKSPFRLSQEAGRASRLEASTAMVKRWLFTGGQQGQRAQRGRGSREEGAWACIRRQLCPGITQSVALPGQLPAPLYHTSPPALANSTPGIVCVPTHAAWPPAPPQRASWGGRACTRPRGRWPGRGSRWTRCPPPASGRSTRRSCGRTATRCLHRDGGGWQAGVWVGLVGPWVVTLGAGNNSSLFSVSSRSLPPLHPICPPHPLPRPQPDVCHGAVLRGQARHASRGAGGRRGLPRAPPRAGRLGRLLHQRRAAAVLGGPGVCAVLCVCGRGEGGRRNTQATRSAHTCQAAPPCYVVLACDRDKCVFEELKSGA